MFFFLMGTTEGNTTLHNSVNFYRDFFFHVCKQKALFWFIMFVSLLKEAVLGAQHCEHHRNTTPSAVGATWAAVKQQAEVWADNLVPHYCQRQESTCLIGVTGWFLASQRGDNQRCEETSPADWLANPHPATALAWMWDQIALKYFCLRQ